MKFEVCVRSLGKVSRTCTGIALNRPLGCQLEARGRLHLGNRKVRLGSVSSLVHDAAVGLLDAAVVSDLSYN